jgi:hypothetical protein
VNLTVEYEKAMPYEEYVNILGEHLKLHQLHYKKFTIDEDTSDIIKTFRSYKILLITESWCGDSLALLPIIRKISEINGHWDIRVLLRDSNLELMDQFLTHGVRGMPMFLFLNEDGELLFKWGPRPAKAAQIFDTHRRQIKEGKIEKREVIKKIRAYYAKDRGLTTLTELMGIFEEQELVEVS